jgi:hypothetical protein
MDLWGNNPNPFPDLNATEWRKQHLIREEIFRINDFEFKRA